MTPYYSFKALPWASYNAAERGELVTGRVHIGNRVTPGLRAVILPGREIGDKAVLAANAVRQKGGALRPAGRVRRPGARAGRARRSPRSRASRRCGSRTSASP